MFANLKKKIEDGGTDLTKELSQANSKPNNSVALGRGVESPLLPRRNLSDSSRQQYGSNDSLMSDTSIQNEATTSIGRVFEASLSNILGSPSKDFEVKIREMTKLLKEEISKRKKVERVLEKQQDLLVARIEEKEEEWKEKTTSIVKDNEQLKKNLSDANIRLERVAKSQDAVEELENFQIQEISKLKHLLLVSEQQLKFVNDDVKLKESDLEMQIQAIDRLTQENNKFKDRLLLEDRDLSRQSDIDMVLECKQQLEEERIKFANLEKDLSKFQERISALTSENETLKEENAKVLQLQECVKSLENEINLFRVQENIMKTRKEKFDELTSLNMNGNASILENNLALQDENVNKQNIMETKRSRELEHLNEKLENVEKLLKLSQEAEERAKEFSQLWEEKASKYSLERDNLVLLNKQLKSELDLLKENLRKTQCELELSFDQVKQLTDEISSSEAEKQNLIDMLAEFRESVKDAQNANNEASRLETLTMNLQDQITEKNKAIKFQQQQINDMKKALHRELRLQTVDSNSNDSNERNFHPKFSASVLGFSRDRPASLSEKLDEVNFKYVKHVVLKYMTSTESEAQHLIRAIGVLLDFTGEEEELVRQTIDWKMSWFGSKPQPSRIHIGNRTIVS